MKHVNMVLKREKTKLYMNDILSPITNEQTSSLFIQGKGPKGLKKKVNRGQNQRKKKGFRGKKDTLLSDWLRKGYNRVKQG